jgi:hypothetical protein
MYLYGASFPKGRTIPGGITITALYGASFPKEPESSGEEVVTPRYGAVFPCVTVVPPAAAVESDTTLVERLAEEMRFEYYKEFMRYRAMVVWSDISEDRKKPWRSHARVAIEFLRKEGR